MNNLNIVEILQQFSPKQKLFVLIFLVLMIGGTTITTTYFTAECGELKEINERLRTENESITKKVDRLTEIHFLILEKTSQLRLAELEEVAKIKQLQDMNKMVIINSVSDSLYPPPPPIMRVETPMVVKDSTKINLIDEILSLAKSSPK